MSDEIQNVASEPQNETEANPLAGAPGRAVVSEETARKLEQMGALKAEAEKVRSAYNAVRSSLFDLGDALIALRTKFREFNPNATDDATRTQLAQLVGIYDLTPQRIGDYINTAERFPKALRDETISFRAYEDARKAMDKAIIPRSPEAVAEIVKREKSGAKAKKAIAAEPLLTVAVAYEDEGRGKYVAGIRWNEGVVSNAIAASLAALAAVEEAIEQRGLLKDAASLEDAAYRARRMPESLRKRAINHLRRIVNASRWKDIIPAHESTRLHAYFDAAERDEPYKAPAPETSEGESLDFAATEGETEEDEEAVEAEQL